MKLYKTLSSKDKLAYEKTDKYENSNQTVVYFNHTIHIKSFTKLLGIRFGSFINSNLVQMFVSRSLIQWDPSSSPSPSLSSSDSENEYSLSKFHDAVQPY